LAALLLALPLFASADAYSEIRITPAGVFSAKNITVMQKAGSTLFSRATWGPSFIRLNVFTNGSSTVVLKNHGEVTTIDAVREGDRIDVEGSLVMGSEGLTMNATVIRDLALLQEGKTLKGTVTSVNPAASSFVLANAQFGSTTVKVQSSTKIVKGLRSITLGDMKKNDVVLSTAGTYDYSSNVFSAGDVRVLQEKNVFVPRNFQGTLKSASGSALPAELTIAVDGTDYTVYLAKDATVLNNKRNTVGLNRFVVGDTVRFFGKIRETDLMQVDASIVRDISF